MPVVQPASVATVRKVAALSPDWAMTRAAAAPTVARRSSTSTTFGIDKHHRTLVI